jgi:hypothetical protein
MDCETYAIFEAPKSPILRAPSSLGTSLGLALSQLRLTNPQIPNIVYRCWPRVLLKEESRQEKIPRKPQKQPRLGRPGH